MVASKFANRVKVGTGTAGTGVIALGAAVAGFRGPTALADGQAYSYSIQDGVNYEDGQGVYTAAGATLSRTTIDDSSNAGALIALSGAAVVNVGMPLARDIGGDQAILGSLSTTGNATFSAAVSVAGNLTVAGQGLFTGEVAASSFYLMEGSTPVEAIFLSGTTLIYGPDSSWTSHAFWIGGAAVLSLSSTALYPQADDAIDLGKTADRFKVAYIEQVSFPSTVAPSSDPNTLDDYREGTFTPVIKFGGNSAGQAYATQVGRYTKVGRLVTVEIAVMLTAKGSSTGAATLSGLPFAPGGVNVPVTLYYSDMALTGELEGIVNGAAVTFFTVSNGVRSVPDNTEFTNTTAINIVATYSV